MEQDKHYLDWNSEDTKILEQSLKKRRRLERILAVLQEEEVIPRYRTLKDFADMSMAQLVHELVSNDCHEVRI